MENATPVSSVTINDVTYSAKDIAKAVMTAIAITPDPLLLSKDSNPIVLANYTKTALFKSEGKLQVIAIGQSHTGYVLVNKHNLKNTKATYVTTNTRNDREAYQGGRSNDRDNRGGGNRNSLGSDTPRIDKRFNPAPRVLVNRPPDGGVSNRPTHRPDNVR